MNHKEIPPAPNTPEPDTWGGLSEGTRGEQIMSLILFFILVGAFLFLMGGVVVMGYLQCTCGGG